MIVLPGDAVPLAVNTDTKLGPGTYLEGGKEGGPCIFDKPGILRRRGKDGSQHFWVHTQQKRVRQTSRTSYALYANNPVWDGCDNSWGDLTF